MRCRSRDTSAREPGRSVSGLTSAPRRGRGVRCEGHGHGFRRRCRVRRFRRCPGCQRLRSFRRRSGSGSRSRYPGPGRGGLRALGGHELHRAIDGNPDRLGRRVHRAIGRQELPILGPQLLDLLGGDPGTLGLGRRPGRPVGDEHREEVGQVDDQGHEDQIGQRRKIVPAAPFRGLRRVGVGVATACAAEAGGAVAGSGCPTSLCVVGRVASRPSDISSDMGISPQVLRNAIDSAR